ncbi:flagellar biosynthesis protein FlaG [Cohnella sp. CFH 77786]|uniref:flagellar protein FlaG n=1 Tax=Cohnella sp. CFH 77786 TaxID=2662265 RepID=UPI001C6095C7|nr:flagellar protein FlaG [Cohnella sp. CFH 77786]MBW5448470.1 flagellar biosynthesis protein FlaG [Cohnella sp. CFH 77786]
MELRSVTGLSALQTLPAAQPSPVDPAQPAGAPVQHSLPSASDLLHKEKYDLSLSEQAVRKAIEKANKAMEGIDRRFEYSVHEKTGEVVVKVINKDTNEVVREIPNEKFLDLMAKLQELVGLNIDEKR